MEGYISRLCDCGYPEPFARSICCEFMRELGAEMLDEYVQEIEGALLRHVEAV